MAGLNKNIIIFGTFFIIVVLAILMVGSGMFTLSLCTSLSLIFIFFFIWHQQKSIFKSQWHKPSNVFLIGFVIVAYQHVWDILLSLKELTNIPVYQVLDEASIVNTFGLAAFLLGYIVTKPNKSYFKRDKHYPRKNSRISNTIIVILQYTFFIGWIATVNVLELLSGKSYFQDVGGSMSSNFESLFFDSTLVLIANTIINSRSEINKFSFFKSLPFFSWVIIVLYCIIRLISGDRGPFIFTVILIFYGYIAFTRRNIKLKKIILVGVLFALLLNIVGMARKMSLNMSFSDRVIASFTDLSSSDESRFGERTIFGATDELAQSSVCTRVAVNLINNENEDYHYGRYFMYGILNVIPFMPSFMSSTLGLPVTEMSSDYLITERHRGDYTESQMGTSIIADSYLDLGIIGVILTMLLAGIVFKYVDTVICGGYVSKIIFVILALLYASKAVYISRSTLLAPAKDIIPITVLFYTNKFLQFKKKLS